MVDCSTLDPVVKFLDLGQAMAEAERCLLCHDPPCSKSCPSGTDPGAFIRKLRFKNVTGAIRTIRVNNILGGSCGLLCPTTRLCESGCCAAGLERPVAIGRIQHALVEHGFAIGFQPLERGPAREERVAVLGAGPAGLACAADLARAGCQVTVFERMPEPGGQLRYGVPEHRYPPALLHREVADIEALGVEIRCSTPVDRDGGAEGLLGEGFSAVFLSPGLTAPVHLSDQPLPENVLVASFFLEALRAGRVEAMRALVQGRRVAVLGGGSVALDCVESAARLGAREVSLVYRRSWLQMPATLEEKLAALQAGVQFLPLQQPTGYVAGAGGQVRQVRLVRTRLGGPDASGRPAPEPVPGSEWTLDVDVVVEALGQAAAPDSPRWYPSAELRADRRVVVDEGTGATSVPGIFAGGDIVRGPGLVVEAVADGKRGARAILAWLDTQKERSS